MQATIQQWIDGSISKTANLPESYTLNEYEDLLFCAMKKGCKGFTTFREGTREGVLSEKKDAGTEHKAIGGDVQSLSNSPIEDKQLAISQVSRPRVLDGKTYQIKEEDNHRTYCTINHVEVDGKKIPWEIFVFSSSRNNELYAALGRLASRIMRKTGDVQSVIDELKEIGGDHGYFTQEYGYVQSKPQHFGFMLEEFAKGLNPVAEQEVAFSICPECGEKAYIREGGCGKCTACLYSKCG